MDPEAPLGEPLGEPRLGPRLSQSQATATAASAPIALKPTAPGFLRMV